MDTRPLSTRVFDVLIVCVISWAFAAPQHAAPSFLDLADLVRR